MTTQDELDRIAQDRHAREAAEVEYLTDAMVGAFRDHHGRMPDPYEARFIHEAALVLGREVEPTALPSVTPTTFRYRP